MNSGPPSILELEPGTFIAGRYELQNRLGTGGMGIVFKALDKDLDDTVALKLLHPHLAQDETVYRRFRNEVLVARALTHPNIVRTHDMGRADGGVSYISMEYVGGKSLRELLQAEWELAQRGFVFEQALEILYSILSGVGYAHGKGIVHRDLKPANVLLSEEDEIKLADFGTARILGMDTSITRMGQIVGTPDYMSPEQIRGEELTPHCDIYSLGIIAYELVTAQRPFTADTPVAVAFKHLNEPIPEAELSKTNVPAWYVSLISIATAKKKEERFSSVSEMAHYLLEYCPELNKPSGFFKAEGSQFTSTGVREAQKPSPSDDTLAEQSSKKFELGEVQPSSSGGWTLSAEVPPELAKAQAERNEASPPSAAPGMHTSPAPQASSPKRRNRLFSIPMLFLIVCVSTFVVLRFIPVTQRPIVEALADLDERDSLRRLLTSAFALDFTVLETTTGVASQTDTSETQEGQERSDLQDELLAFVEQSDLSTTTTTDSEAESDSVAEVAQKQESEKAAVARPEESTNSRTGSSELAEQSKQANTKESNADSGKESDKSTSAGSLAATAAESSATQSGDSQEVAPPKPSGARLSLLKGSSEIDDDSVRFEELSSMRWQAELRGMTAPNSRQKQREFQQSTKINVFDPRTAKVVASQEAHRVSTKGSALVVEGRLGTVARQLKEIGLYRFDVIYDGEVLESKEVSLYKASVSLAMPRNTSASQAGGRVAIVRGAQVVEPKNSTTEKQAQKDDDAKSERRETAAQTASATEGASTTVHSAQHSSQSRGVEPVVNDSSGQSLGKNIPNAREQDLVPSAGGSRVFIQPRSGSGMADPYASDTRVSASGLPLARGARGDAEQNAENSNATSQESSSVDRTSYSGTFSIAVGTQEEQERAFILTLRTKGAKITGSANIAGFDTFRVEGKALTRGVELNLSNAEYSVRLSGGRRGSSLKGVYFFPALNQRGRWEVNTTN